jgi:DNA-binding NarL/FixJ family response regulator
MPPHEPPPARLRLVVVDDHAAVRTALADLLEDEGYEVVGEGANGQEALSLVATHEPDAVVLDVRMPVMDGLQAARQLHSRYPAIRLVMLSAYDDPSLQLESLEAGASAFLVKGCPRAELLAALTGRAGADQ